MVGDVDRGERGRMEGGAQKRRRMAVRVVALFVLAGALASWPASSVGAQATDGCDVQSIAIEQVDEHVPTDAPEFTGLFDAGRVSDRVAIRSFTLDGGGAGLMLFVNDARSVGAAEDGHGEHTAGFRDALREAGVSVAGLTVTREGVIGSSALHQGLVQRTAEAREGRIILFVMAVIDERFDDPASEEAFLFEQLDAQLARIPEACHRDAPAEEDRSGYVTGAVAAVGLAVFVAPAFVAWLRDPTARRRARRRGKESVGFVQHDVAADARADLRAARNTDLALLLGLGVSSLAALGYVWNEPGLFAAVPLGIFVSWAASALTSRRAPEWSRPEPWLRTARRPVLSFVALAFSLGFLALGLFGAARRIYMATLTDNELEVLAALNQTDPVLFREQPLWLALAGFALGGATHRLARRLAQRRASEVIATDDRPPVLLLRSFGDDGLRVRVRTQRHGLAEMVHLRRTQRFEEMVGWTLSSAGPVTTVADPRLRREPLGAARERLSQESWLPVVRERIASAGKIALIAGQTQGLEVELEAIRDLGRLDDTLVVIPPTMDAVERWAYVAERLGIAARLDPSDQQTVIVAFRRGIPHAFVGAARDAPSYRAAAHAALELTSRSAEPDAAGAPLPPPLPQSASAGVQAMSVRLGQ